jgi:hypothetical protein
MVMERDHISRNTKGIVGENASWLPFLVKNEDVRRDLNGDSQ